MRALVRSRAQGRCEYCHFPAASTRVRFSIDHIVARKHGGRSDPENLALSCLLCNHCKGTNLSGIDPQTHQIVPLFHPRRQVRNEHFAWDGARVAGLTPTGRATVAVLNMNDSLRIALRQNLIDEGVCLF